MALKLVEPDISLESAYRAYLDALDHAGGHGANYAGVLKELNNDYPALVQWFDELRAGDHLPSDCTSGRVYWLMRGEGIIGESQLVHHSDIGYTVGYVIHPQERLKGYGTKILALTLEKAKALGATSALLTCRKENIGSRKIIEQNGGVLIKEEISAGSGKTLLRYMIEIKSSSEE